MAKRQQTAPKSENGIIKLMYEVPKLFIMWKLKIQIAIVARICAPTVVRTLTLNFCLNSADL